jgi:DNA processing protein
LIKQGAKLVENAKDIIDELSHILISGDIMEEPGKDKTVYKNIRLSPSESEVLKALEPYPVHIDELARKIKIGSGKLLGILLRLELQDIVKQSPGKLFSSNMEAEEK